MIYKRVSRVKEVEQALLEKLEEIKSPAGTLPSETEIGEMFNVSRMTARQALSSLEHKGIVVRKQGLGTFVNSNILSIQSRLDEAIEFSELIRRSGFEPGVRVVSSSTGPASAHIAARLDIERAEETLAIHKVFTADGTPVIYCVDIAPLRYAAVDVKTLSLETDDLSAPIYDLLGAWFNQTVAYLIAEIEPWVADKRIAKALDYRPDGPILLIEQTGYNAEERPVFFTQEYYRPGFIHFRLPRRMG